MGKSPAKWVKSILRGKKSSKSYPSKKAADEENAPAPPQTASTELSGTSTLPNLAPHTTATEVKSELEQARSGRASYEDDIPVAANETDESCVTEFNSSKEAENLCLEEPATGFTEYHSLEGITRLQALVRGHLVRRQALATLHCVRGIVKLQAVARGRSIRCSDTGLEVRKKCSFQADVTETRRFSPSIILGKQSSNAFASKILASSVSALPLNLQYDPEEPNSAPKWLERWSSSHFWGSAVHQKEALSSNSKQQGKKTIKVESKAPAPPKHEVKKAAATNVDNSSLHSSLDHGKSKRSNRKHVTPNVETVVQDNPENELERVKRSLRKISLNNKEASGKSEPVAELPKKSSRNVPVSPAPDAISKSEAANEELNQITVHNSEPVMTETIADETNPSDVQPEKPEMHTELESHVVPESNGLSFNHSAEPCTEENGVDAGKYSLMNEEKVSKEDNYFEYDHKSRRKSVLAKQEYCENSPQNTRTVPSYMAATASAKAKLRGLGSPKVAEEGDEDAVIRRHSLPSSANGKLSSMSSPRIQKVVSHSNGKDRARADRSLTSSRDGHGKGLKPDWRR